MPEQPLLDEIRKELLFVTSRASGPGGQHVNKVNTRVTLRWDVIKSTAIEEDQRRIIAKKLARDINNEGILVLSSEETRSQLKNKEDVVFKLEKLLKTAFRRQKRRKPTRPTKVSVLKRLDSKKKQSLKKKLRKTEE